MGQIYNFLGLTRRLHRPRPDRRRAPRRLCLRHHLRHQQRVRLRLSARQHEVPARGDGPAALQLRASSTRSTSILIDEARTPLIISGPTEDSSELYIAGRQADPEARSRALREGREAARGDADRGRRRAGSSSCCARPACSRAAALRHRQRHARASRQPGAARAQAVHAATPTTSSRTARSSSSTSSPAA